jgi:hypothetical protein
MHQVLQASQSIITGYLSFLALLLVLRYASLLVVKWTTAPPVADETGALRLWINRLTFMLLLIATLIFFWAAMGMATSPHQLPPTR